MVSNEHKQFGMPGPYFPSTLDTTANGVPLPMRLREFPQNKETLQSIQGMLMDVVPRATPELLEMHSSQIQLPGTQGEVTGEMFLSQRGPHVSVLAAYDNAADEYLLQVGNGAFTRLLVAQPGGLPAWRLLRDGEPMPPTLKSKFPIVQFAAQNRSGKTVMGEVRFDDKWPVGATWMPIADFRYGEEWAHILAGTRFDELKATGDAHLTPYDDFLAPPHDSLAPLQIQTSVGGFALNFALTNVALDTDGYNIPLINRKGLLTVTPSDLVPNPELYVGQADAQGTCIAEWRPMPGGFEMKDETVILSGFQTKERFMKPVPTDVLVDTFVIPNPHVIQHHFFIKLRGDHAQYGRLSGQRDVICEVSLVRLLNTRNDVRPRFACLSVQRLI